MAGIYIHIPFCVQKCGYCDFYSVIRLTSKDDFVSALIKEIGIRKNELNGQKIQTIYFGGGTPSVLKISDFEKIFQSISDCFDIKDTHEITIEVNPDDITFNYLNSLKKIGFNRLSIGVQSFNNSILAFMNRRHNSDQVIEAISIAKQVGFRNISIDLIYGIPNMSIDCWKDSIQEAINLDIQHISAYHLTFEPNTPFYTKLKKNEIVEINDGTSVIQYNILVDKLTKAGFIDYEISNFSKPFYNSQHNSNYWSGINYLGFGPSAHSYVDNVRSWNISDIYNYLDLLRQNKNISQLELLTQKDIFNEFIMLGLRTRKGLDPQKIFNNFEDSIINNFNRELNSSLKLKNVCYTDGFITVCRDKKFLTDKIIADFFMV